MKHYFAPMEGITGYLYRNAHHSFFPQVDKYFTPFVVPTQSKGLHTKELRDVLPENNPGICIVPQILTNSAKDFLVTADKLEQLGYKEINLNLGCPSKTVVSKGRGSGFLEFPDKLDRFLEEIFEQCKMKISIKTRVGRYEREEFERLLAIYNQYPLEELIIHPRLQVDYYKNKPDIELFQNAMDNSSNRLCYNGDIMVQADYERIIKQFPKLDYLMIGRGMLRNPGFLSFLFGEKPLDNKTLLEFHNTIYEGYQELLFGERNVLFKMKELWSYWILLFPNGEKLGKKIRKAERCAVYDAVVRSLFEGEEIKV